MLAGAIIERAARELHDPGYTRWSLEEHLGNLTGAVNLLGLVLPRATAVTKVIRLAADTVKHTLPDGTASFLDPSGSILPEARQLMRIVRNMGGDGATPGRAVTLIGERQLSEFDPDWPTAHAATAVRHYMYDAEGDSKVFYSYPKAHAVTDVWVEAQYSRVHPSITDVADTLHLVNASDFQEPLFHMAMALALYKNTESVTQKAEADAHYKNFFQLLGLKPPATRMDSPRAKREEGQA